MVKVGNRGEIALASGSRVNVQLEIYCPAFNGVASVGCYHSPCPDLPDPGFLAPGGSTSGAIGPGDEAYCTGDLTIFPKLLCWHPPGTTEKCTHYPDNPSWHLTLP